MLLTLDNYIDPSDDDDEPGNGIASLGQDDDEDFDDDMEYDVDDDQEREYKNVDMMKMISESASVISSNIPSTYHLKGIQTRKTLQTTNKRRTQ